jgi:outer membrane protein OmpA-like peptidoglycan-associated protein/tetratricopeptide (TPR) repeat protein
LIIREAGIFFLHRILAIALVFLLSVDVLFAQKEHKVIRRGIRLIEQGFHKKALDKLNSFIKKDSSFSEVNLLASICYLNVHEPHKALKLVNRISEEDNCINYYKALCYYNLEMFDEAIKLLDEVDKISCYHQLSKNELVSLIDHAYLSYNNSKGFLVRNLGKNINSKDRDYCAVMLNKFDSVLFTSRRLEEHHIVADDGMGYESIYATNMDVDQTWRNPTKFNLDIHSIRNHEATSQVIDDGKEVIIFRNGDLYFAKKINDKWVQQERLNVINTGHNETHGFLTSDRKTVYFSSNYLSDDNNNDLFVSTINAEGIWSEPEAIEELNTPFDEDAPFIAEDGTFYFSSRGHNSIGGYDVFSTRYDKKTDSWAPIENLGHPVNTVADDIYFTTYGKVGYLSSSRLGGEGMLDLYQVFLFNKIKLQGKVLDSLQSTPIPGAKIDVSYGHWFIRGYSDYEGNYEMYVPINKKMQIFIQKDTVSLEKGNYLVNVSFGNQNKNIYDFNINMSLDQDEGPVISADLTNPSDTVTINLIVKNDLEHNEVINNVSEISESVWVDSLNSIYRERHIFDSLAFRELQAQKETLDTILTRVYFEFDKFELKDSTRAILSNYIDIISQTEYDQLEICGYTDAVGTEKYNQVLSIKRAKAVSSFLVEKGITVDQMIVKGLGEKKLLEHHEGRSVTNRRVELVLKKNLSAQEFSSFNGL